MAKAKKEVVIWQNSTGVVLSNAGNLFLETNGNARTYWVPKGDYTNKGGTTVLGESSAGNAVNNATDTFRGGPSLRTEHLFRIDLNTEPDGAGWDKLFLQWEGECVTSSGFAITGAGNSYGPQAWASTGRAWAMGSFTDNARGTYANLPPMLCYNSAQFGNQAAVMSGVDANTNLTMIECAGGMGLQVRGFQPVIASAGDARAHFFRFSGQRLTHSVGDTQLSCGGLVWGYTKTSGAGADQSRYPTAGDQYGWVYEVGYPVNIAQIAQASASSYSHITPLTVSGLSTVWVAVYEVSPATGANAGIPGITGNSFLVFSNASMTVKGKITAILLRE